MGHNLFRCKHNTRECLHTLFEHTPRACVHACVHLGLCIFASITVLVKNSLYTCMGNVTVHKIIKTKHTYT